MVRVGPRDGVKFTVEQRRLAQAKAWKMHLEGTSQLDIAIELDVAQSMVCRWLQEIRAQQPEVQAVVAERIRAELVCCDIYQQMAEASGPEDDESRRLRLSAQAHAICFYGEWAARIAESVK